MKKISFLTVIALILISFGCGTTTTNVSNTGNSTVANAPSNTETVKNTGFTPSGNPKEDVIKSTVKMQELSSWAAVASSETMPDLTMEMEYSAPDRYHVKREDGEIIVIGGDTYVKEEDKWEKIPENFSEQINAMKKTFTEEGMKAIKDVQMVGKEMVNGKETTAYVYKISGDKNMGETTTKAWIGNDTGLPVKIEVESKIGKTTQKLTTNYIYDKQIKIEAPPIE
jgi:hypothetical protein